MKLLVLSLLTSLLFYSKANAQTFIKIEDANKHIGDSVKICSKIYGGNFYSRIQGSPTYLYVGDDFPKNPLAVFILKKDRENFEDRPEMMYVYKDVCISGKLELDKGKPVLVVTKPAQIILQK